MPRLPRSRRRRPLRFCKRRTLSNEGTSELVEMHPANLSPIVIAMATGRNDSSGTASHSSRHDNFYCNASSGIMSSAAIIIIMPQISADDTIRNHQGSTLRRNTGSCRTKPRKPFAASPGGRVPRMPGPASVLRDVPGSQASEPRSLSELRSHALFLKHSLAAEAQLPQTREQDVRCIECFTAICSSRFSLSLDCCWEDVRQGVMRGRHMPEPRQ